MDVPGVTLRRNADGSRKWVARYQGADAAGNRIGRLKTFRVYEGTDRGLREQYERAVATMNQMISEYGEA